MRKIIGGADEKNDVRLSAQLRSVRNRTSAQ